MKLALALAAALALGALPLLTSSNYIVGIGVSALIFTVAAAALNLVYGFTGLLSFAQLAFWGIGGYTSALTVVTFGGTFWSGLVWAALINAAVALVVGYPTLRLLRWSIGPLTLGDLELGQARPLTIDEINALRKLAGLTTIKEPRTGERRAAGAGRAGGRGEPAKSGPGRGKSNSGRGAAPSGPPKRIRLVAGSKRTTSAAKSRSAGQSAVASVQGAKPESRTPARPSAKPGTKPPAAKGPTANRPSSAKPGAKGTSGNPAKSPKKEQPRG